MNILLTDILFPNKYAKWRLVEIKSFIDEYKCDILVVNKITNYAGIKYDFDYEILKEKFSLEEYDILIFNKNYNFVNKYNSRIDGTQFNNIINADYMFCHKSKNIDISNFNLTQLINAYDFIYHIFLISYQKFNHHFKYPHNKQIIHLYPGGGYLSPASLNNIHKDANIVVSQQFISKQIIHNKFINVYGGGFYNKDENIKIKNRNTDELCVCFTSMGCPIAKGLYIYYSIVEQYNIKYPNNNVKFISIGINKNTNKNIVSYQPMPQDELSNFYNNNVDVVISLDTGVQINGFPLGVEAIMEGCVVLTTDKHNQNVLNEFNFDPFYIIDTDDIDDIIMRINSLTDKNILRQKSNILQNRIYELFNYDNTILRTFNFIKSLNKNNL